MLKESSSSTKNFWNGKSAKKASRDTHHITQKLQSKFLAPTSISLLQSSADVQKSPLGARRLDL
jgi:hypothetical protein